MAIILLLLGTLVIIGIVVTAFFFEFISVKGQSMYPGLKSGQVVLIKKRLQKKDMIIGRIYVYTPFEKSLVIKRLVSIREKDVLSNWDFFMKYWMEGDNKNHSKDSRVYGYVELSQVVGVVIKIFGEGVDDSAGNSDS